ARPAGRLPSTSIDEHAAPWQAAEKWRGYALFGCASAPPAGITWAIRGVLQGVCRSASAGSPFDTKRDRGRTGDTKNMTKKSDIIEAVAGKAGLSRADATSAV